MPVTVKIAPRLIVTRSKAAIAVSHKFVPTPDSLDHLRYNSGRPNFKRFEILDLNKKFEDVYYDSAPVAGRKLGLLGHHNIFVRRRQWSWQADFLSGADGAESLPDPSNLTSSYVECLTDRGAAESLVQKHVPGAQLLLFGATSLRELETLRINREVYKLDDKFQVHVDILTGVESLFNYRVGEVALSQPPSGGDEQSAIRRMADEVSEFMEKYAWAFPDRGQAEGGVHGTLQAYMLWKKKKLKLAPPEEVEIHHA